MNILNDTIVTERLRIVPFSRRHLTENYLAWLNDKELLRYSEQRHIAHTLSSCEAYWATFEGSKNKFWAIEECLEGRGHIGNINMYFDEENSVAELGILLGDRTAHHKGYALEAWGGVCDWLLLVQKVRKVAAGTMSVNTAMLRLMRKSGMVMDGVRLRHRIFEGQCVDIVYMALFNGDFRGVDESGGCLL